MKNKTIIIGDCHIGHGISIGRSFGNSLNSRIVDQFKILEWILDTGLEHEVDRFVFTGDIFEEMKPDHNMVVMFLSWLNKCSESGIECHIIAGNHDLKRVGSRYSSVLDIIEACNIPNVFIYNHIYTLKTEGASFTFIPFRDKRSMGTKTCEEAIDKLFDNIQYEVSDCEISDKKIMVGHLAIEKSFYTDEFDDASNELMIPISYFKGFDYVWMGHVHNPQLMNKENPLVEHVGSMDLSDFGETKQVKNLIFYDANIDKFERIKIPSRPLRRVRLEIEEKEPTSKVIDEINKINKDFNFERAIVKLEVKILNPEAENLDRKFIIEHLNSLNISHISSFSESKNMTIIPVSKMKIKDSAIDPKEAVKLISDSLNHETEDDKNEFISICNEIIEEVKSKRK